MAIRGLREKIVHIYNPLPRVGFDELVRRAELDQDTFREGTNRISPFMMYWQHSSGPEAETIWLAPGDLYPLRQSEAEAFLRQYGEAGAVAVTDPNDPDELLRESIRGTRTAVEFYRPHGTAKVRQLMRSRQLNKDDYEDFKYEYTPYLIAQSKIDVLKEHLEALRKADGFDAVVLNAPEDEEN